MKALRPASSLAEIPDRVARFRESCLLYCDHLKTGGKSLKPFVSPELPVFSKLAPELQDRAIDRTIADIELFEAMEREGYSLRDTPKLLWRSMGRLGLMPSSDVFDKIGEGDVVEIYLVDSQGQNQVFRNLNFFDYTSFTFEHMAALDWRLSVSRDPKYIEQIGAHALEIMTGRRTETYFPGIEPHVGIEIDSPGLFEVRVSIHSLSPVRKQGQVVGAMSIETLELVKVGRPDYYER